MVDIKPENIRRQYRNPEGEDGRTVLEGMNEHHVPIWECCLASMPKVIDGTVMDIGCGGGGLIARLSQRYPYAQLVGVDISQESLDMTAKVNRGLIDDGRLSLHRCSVDDMPLADGSVDVITAVETYFFWPDLTAALAEIHRVLSPGGRVFIGSEMQLRDDNTKEMERASELYYTRLVRDEVMLDLMRGVGFDARAVSEDGTDMVVFIGCKKM